LGRNHKILEVGEGASKDEIKRAYRKKAKLYHPDINKQPNAQRKFIEIKRAYEYLLKGPVRRVVSRAAPKATKTTRDIRRAEVTRRRERARQFLKKKREQDLQKINNFQKSKYFQFFRTAYFSLYGVGIAISVSILGYSIIAKINGFSSSIISSVLLAGVLFSNVYGLKKKYEHWFIKELLGES